MLKKETQILTTHKTFTKTHIVQQTKHHLRHDKKGKIIFEFQKIGWNLWRMRINYKLKKRTKTEKYKKPLRTNNIVYLLLFAINWVPWQHHWFSRQLEAYATSHFTTAWRKKKQKQQTQKKLSEEKCWSQEKERNFGLKFWKSHIVF